MQVLVTGGGGFLGRYLVEALLAQGHHVRSFSRGDYPDLRSQGVDVLQGDLRSAEDVTRAVQGMQTVFHVAAVPGIWGRWETFHDINTLGTENVVQACQTHRVESLVYTSSPSVIYDGRAHLNATEDLPYPDRYLCHYPHSKALAEKMVLAANSEKGLKTIALRPHLIWGPRDNHLIPRLVQRAKSGRLACIGQGENVVSTSYVENTAAAHLQAWEALGNNAPCAGKAYFINEPEPVQLWKWIDEILALGGLPPVKRRLSHGAAALAGLGCEALWTLLRRQDDPPMTRFLASQLSQSHSYSIANAQRDFGYTPVVSMEEGMRRLTPDVQALAAR